MFSGSLDGIIPCSGASVHLYLDESYGKDVYVLAALAVYDSPSQEAIARAVSQAVILFKEYLRTTDPRRFDRLPGKRILELKGAESRGKTKPYVPGLNNYPELRDRLFRDLVKVAPFRIYVLYFDRPELMKWMPKLEIRKYGRLLQNLIADVEVLPPHARLFSITIDSQNTTKATHEDGKLYTWRKRRAGQRKQRIADKARHRRWIQQIKAMLLARYQRIRMNRKIWLVASHNDRGLQIADVIANFCKRYSHLNIHEAPHAHTTVSHGEREWFQSYQILADRIWWIHNRRLRKPKHV